MLCYSEDEKLLDEDRGFILFDILAFSATEAEQLRLNDGTPYHADPSNYCSTALRGYSTTSAFDIGGIRL